MNTQQEIFVRRSYRANERRIEQVWKNARNNFREFSGRNPTAKQSLTVRQPNKTHVLSLVKYRKMKIVEKSCCFFARFWHLSVVARNKRQNIIMNILAATKQSYKDTKYIVELKSDELTALLTLSSYSDIPVTDNEGNKTTRERDEMQSGDVIESSYITNTQAEIRLLREQKSEIDKAFSSLRGAMTKVQNIIQPSK